MGTASAIIGVVSAGVSAGVSIKKMKDAKDMREVAQKEIEDFEHQNLNTLQVSTASEEFLQKESARGYATTIDSLRESGARAQAATLPKLDASFNTRNEKMYAGLDKKQKELDLLQVKMQEQRNREILQGYGGMMNVGMQNQYQGMTDLVNSVGNLGAQTENLFKDEEK